MLLYQPIDIIFGIIFEVVTVKVNILTIHSDWLTVYLLFTLFFKFFILLFNLIHMFRDT